VLGASRFTKTPVVGLTPDTIREVLELELQVHLELVTCLAAHLVDGARVVLFTDTAVAFGWADYPVYLAAKGGLDAAVRSLALALGPRVTVFAVAPGSLEGTPPPPDGDPRDTTALGRRGRRTEVAAAVTGLMGLPSAVVQGATVAVDGGRRLRHAGL
jgi:NAD(P)-dependent dehydrogenase (short-subunit alcohol dehydrogenase family)